MGTHKVTQGQRLARSGLPIVGHSHAGHPKPGTTLKVPFRREPRRRGTSLMAQWVKHPPVMQETQETWVWSLSQEDPLEEEMATHTHMDYSPCNPMDYSPPGSSVYGILQARILGWVAISFWRSSQPRDGNSVSYVSFIGRQASVQP